MPHYHPGETLVARDQPLLVDWGALFKGYCSDLTRTLMIGRQGIRLSPEELAACFAEFGLPCDRAEAGRILTAADGYAEPFFRALGADEVSSLDVSGAEGSGGTVGAAAALQLSVAATRSATPAVLAGGGSLSWITIACSTSLPNGL